MGNNDGEYDEVRADLEDCDTYTPQQDVGAQSSITSGSGTTNQHLVFRRNISYDNLNPITFQGTDWTWYNNTSVGNNFYYGGSDYSGVGPNTRRNPATVKNNISVGHNGAEIRIGWEDALEIDGHLYHDDAGADPTPLDLDVYEDQTYTTLASWKTKLAGMGNVGDGVGGNGDANAVTGDPVFVNVSSDFRPTSAPGSYDFRITDDSAALNNAVHLTETDAVYSGAGGETVIGVDNVNYFFDTFGHSQETSDYVKIGYNSPIVQIKANSINYGTDEFTVTREISGGANEPVWVCENATYCWHGPGPDIGYYEFIPNMGK
jgi:hypothetical protein